MPRLIEIKNLVKNYYRGDVTIPVLREMSLHIEQGEFVAIMGPSGSGKSTLMNILGCLDKPTSGAYLLDGVNAGNLDRDELAEIRSRKIGFVFQRFDLLARLSSAENVELPLLYNGTPPAQHRDKAMAALHAVGLEGREEHNPNQLSGGQQQRVAIARALVKDPQLILADEPTGALDTRTSVEIMAIFQRLNRDRGISVIVVTHEPDIAAYANRVIHMRDGVITSDEIVKQPRDAESELEEMAVGQTSMSAVPGAVMAGVDACPAAERGQL